MSQETILAAFQAELSGLPAEDRAPRWLPGHVIEFFSRRLDELVHQLGGIETVVSLAQNAYRTYVAPFDLPGIPNIVEPAVDTAAEHLIGVSLRAAHDALHKE